MIPTQQHGEIRRWALKQGAQPARLAWPHERLHDGEPSILTFVFGVVPETQQEIALISWEMFFAQFDLLQLSMAFDESSRQFAIVKVRLPAAAHSMH